MGQAPAHSQKRGEAGAVDERNVGEVDQTMLRLDFIPNGGVVQKTGVIEPLRRLDAHPGWFAAVMAAREDVRWRVLAAH